MENIKTEVTTQNRKTIYKNTFTSKGSIKIFVDYFLTHKVPEKSLKYGARCISFTNFGNGEIQRVMTSPLPNSALASTFIGEEPVHIKYDGVYDDNILVLKAVNSERINNFFKFTEILTIVEENGILTFEREATIFNATKYGITSVFVNYQEYEDFFNDCSLSVFYGISEEINK